MNEIKKFFDNLNTLFEKANELDLKEYDSWIKIVDNSQLLLTSTITDNDNVNKLMQDIISKMLDYFERKELEN